MSRLLGSVWANEWKLVSSIIPIFHQKLTCAHLPSSAQVRYWKIFKANSYGSSTSKKGMSLTSFCKRTDQTEC